MRQTFRYNNDANFMLLCSIENKRTRTKVDVLYADRRLLLLRKTRNSDGGYDQENEPMCGTTDPLRHEHILRGETLSRVAPSRKIWHAHTHINPTRRIANVQSVFRLHSRDADCDCPQLRVLSE